MNAGAAIVGRQNRYMRRFEEAGATSPADASTLEALGCRRSFSFGRLLQRGVFVEVEDGRYYLDVVSAEAFRARRRIVVLVAVGIAVVAVIVGIWIG